MGHVVRFALLFLLALYQLFLSPLLRLLIVDGGCRFDPTCSEYARLAITHHGVRKGVQLTFRRLLRCHPFHPGGYDPPIRGS